MGGQEMNGTMADNEITRARIDELLRFLPQPPSPGPQVAPTSGSPNSGSELRATRDQISPLQVYELFEKMSRPWWSDHNYVPDVVAEMVCSRERISRATLSEIKSMLTYCVRGERFCEGHFEALVQNGVVGAILQRLAELRDSVE